MSLQETLIGNYKEDLLGVFGDPALVLTRGQGCNVTDANGKTYLDLLAGIAVNSLGYAHPVWVEAVSRQAGELAHISNFFTSPQQLELAGFLLEKLGATEAARVFFCNSGTEANEAAYKLARRYGNREGKPKILALDHAFHGRTLGALSLTWKSAYRDPFAPLPGGIEHIPATLDALEKHLDDEVAALIIEPIQGEAGVYPLPEGYLARARELTRQHGTLLIIDEVQTGMGRTGRWFETHRELTGENLPDAVTLAKGLGGGFPIGAMMVIGDGPLALLEPGMHGTTFGGNPLACATALATVTTLEQENLLEHAAELGARAQKALLALDAVAEVRGAGLLIGAVLAESERQDGAPLAPALVAVAREAGYIINATGPDTIRLAPPLIITEEELLGFIERLPELCERARTSA